MPLRGCFSLLFFFPSNVYKSNDSVLEKTKPEGEWASFHSANFCAFDMKKDSGIWACTKSNRELGKLGGGRGWCLGPGKERWKWERVWPYDNDTRILFWDKVVVREDGASSVAHFLGRAVARWSSPYWRPRKWLLCMHPSVYLRNNNMKSVHSSRCTLICMKPQNNMLETLAYIKVHPVL